MLFISNKCVKICKLIGLNNFESIIISENGDFNYTGYFCPVNVQTNVGFPVLFALFSADASVCVFILHTDCSRMVKQPVVSFQ